MCIRCETHATYLVRSKLAHTILQSMMASSNPSTNPVLILGVSIRAIRNAQVTFICIRDSSSLSENGTLDSDRWSVVQTGTRILGSSERDNLCVERLRRAAEEMFGAGLRIFAVDNDEPDHSWRVEIRQF